MVSLQHIDEVNSAIEKGLIKIAFKKLKTLFYLLEKHKIVDDHCKHLKDRFLLLSGDYHRNYEKELLKLSGEAVTDTNRNRITSALIEMTSEIGEIINKSEISNNGNGQTGASTKSPQEKVVVEITLHDKELASFSAQERDQFFDAMAVLLKMDKAEIVIKSIKSGSVKITIELDEDKARELERLIVGGGLGEWGDLSVKRVIPYEVDPKVLAVLEERGIGFGVKDGILLLIGVNLSGADLIGVNLSGADLSGADLSGADLSLADLSLADLSLANLSGANLSGAYLFGAKLSLANLFGAKLRGVDLREADLSEADLREAYLRGAKLIRVKLIGADLRGADLSETDWSETDLRGAYLRGAYLRGAYLSGVILSGADLSGAYLSGVKLTGADLTGADLIGAYLIGVNLIGVNLIGVDLRGADLRGANWRGAKLRGAKLRGADLREANLSGADLREANLRGADLREADLSLAMLSGADLREAFFHISQKRYLEKIGVNTKIINFVDDESPKVDKGIEIDL